MSDPHCEDPPRFYGTRGLVWFGVWLVFLAYPIADIVSNDHSTAWTIAAWTTLAVFVFLYLRTISLALGAGLRASRPRDAGWLLALALLTFTAILVFGPDWSGLTIYLGVATIILPDRPALLALTGITATTVVVDAIAGVSRSNIAFNAFLTAALGVAMLGVRRLFEMIADLRDARDEIARLTVAEQRSRFARDLHDVLGHNLSVIALKSQVARRTITTDPDVATAAIDDVETVARQSLRDVRELVSGYRQRPLDQELDVASELLTSAGIDPLIERPAELPEPPADELLAWALREGTTNVLRHSRAGRCRITLDTGDGEARLEIVDDGTPTVESANGSGLRGLRERLAAAGGTLDAGPTDGGGFRLAVRVPL
jgi:two-component system sensor histidine kinase DesK